MIQDIKNRILRAALVVAIGASALALVLIHYSSLSPQFIAGLFIIVVGIGVWWFQQNIYDRVVSPYLLASMFVRGMRKGQYAPAMKPSSEVEPHELMVSLNELAEHLKIQQQTIRRLETLRIEFVANVSHELRTPLTSIKGYTETLRGGALKDPEAAEKFLSRIEENAERLRALISDLLDLSKLEGSPQEVEWEIFSAAELSQKLDDTFFPVLQKKNQHLILKFSDAELEGDRQKLEQVFVNLIDNACRYTQEGSLIEVFQTHDERNFIYEVKDNGPGIASEHLPRLFERFYRVDKARSRETGGTGLGLAIVKHISMVHGGNIQVQSQLNEGTRFKIFIPRRHL